VRNSISTGQVGNLDHSFGDQRSGNRGAEQILALVKRVGPEHWEHEVAHEFLAQILNVDVIGGNAELERFRTCCLKFVALAKVSGEGYHLAPIGILQPLQDH
jgi:hypothetical protein